MIYITNTSLGGCVEDEARAIDWVNPDQVHAFIAGWLEPIRTYLYRRRLYETVVCWDGPMDGYPPEHRDFARIWQKAQKMVSITNADRRSDTRHACRAGLRFRG